MLVIWVISGIIATPLSFIVIGISVIVLWNKGEFFKVLMGLCFILLLSDNLQPALSFASSAKAIYMLLVGALYIVTNRKINPKSEMFVLFLPFLIYTYITLYSAGSNFLTGFQKTISYTILLLAVPSIAIFSINEKGIKVLRDLLYMFLLVLLVGLALKYVSFDFVHRAERFTNLLGNPNGLGIFLMLIYLLFRLVNYVVPNAFSRNEKIFIYLFLFYNLILCSSRTAMGGIAFFFISEKLFRVSSFVGILGLLVGLFAFQYLFVYLPDVIVFFNLEEYFRLQTLEEGSGRFIAWEFAWQKIQDNLFFGGGFGFDEFNMRKNYAFLQRLGHSGGVHNSYLSLWFDFGLVGLILYFRSFFLAFYKMHKKHIIAFPLMFTIMFSITYESWLVASLNPYTILLYIMMATLLFYTETAQTDKLTENT